MCRTESVLVEVRLDTQPEKVVAKDLDESVEKVKEQPKEAGPDGAESVRIAVACFFISFLCSAGFRSAGFLYIGIMDTYGVSRQEASWPLSLIGAISNLAGLISGPLVQRYPVKPIMFMGAFAASLGMTLSFWASTVGQLAITLGILYGFGVGIIFTIINVTLSQYFVKYRGMAFGVVHGGSTLASFVFPNLLLFLNQHYPFKSVMLLFGGIVLHMFVFAFFIKEPSWVQKCKSKDGVEDESNQKASLRESLTIFKEPVFYVCLLSNMFFSYGFDAFMTTLVDFATDRDATLQQAVNLLPWFSLADVTGRMLFPIVADRGLIERRHLSIISYVLTGVFTIMLPFSTSYIQLVIFIVLMGAFCGCAFIVFNCLVGDTVGMRRIPLAFGIVGCVNGSFYFTKPFFFGYFRDVVRSYDAMFCLTGSLSVFTGLMWAVVTLCDKVKSKRDLSKILENNTLTLEDIEKKQPEVKISIAATITREESIQNNELAV